MTSPEFADDVLATVRGIPGVDDAVAVVRRRARFSKPAPAAPVVLGSPPSASAVLASTARQPAADLYGGPLRAPSGASATLQQALRAAAELAPGKGTVYIRAGRQDVLQTYPVLLAEAERVLAGLRAAGLRPGVHYCIGATLGKLQGQIALNGLLDRFPVLSTDPDDPPRFFPSPDIMGAASLPLRTGR